MNEIFGERLRQSRQRHGWTIRDLSNIAHVKPHTISNYELFLSEPSMSRMVVLARALDVSLDYLCGLTKNPDISSNHPKKKTAKWVHMFDMDTSYQKCYVCSQCGRREMIAFDDDILRTAPYCHCGCLMGRSN